MKGIMKAVPFAVLSFLVGLPGTAAAQHCTVSVTLLDTLSTGSSQRGDTFSDTLTSPLIWQNRVVADRGARVTGRVTQVTNSGWFKRPALITLSLGTAQARSGSFPVQTGDLTIKSDSQAKRNLLIIVGTAALGAAIGDGGGGGEGAGNGVREGGGAGPGGGGGID